MVFSIPKVLQPNLAGNSKLRQACNNTNIIMIIISIMIEVVATRLRPAFKDNQITNIIIIIILIRTIYISLIILYNNNHNYII